MTHNYTHHGYMPFTIKTDSPTITSDQITTAMANELAEYLATPDTELLAALVHDCDQHFELYTLDLPNNLSFDIERREGVTGSEFLNMLNSFIPYELQFTIAESPVLRVGRQRLYFNDTIKLTRRI